MYNLGKFRISVLGMGSKEEDDGIEQGEIWGKRLKEEDSPSRHAMRPFGGLE